MGESKSFLALERLINVVGRRHGVYLKAARAELEKAREVLSERFQKEAILKCESALPGEAQAESFPHQGEETGIRDVGAGDGTTTLAEAKVAWMDSIAFSAELSDKPIVSVYANRRACEQGNPCIRLSRADPEETWKCTAIRVYVFDADKYDKSYANPCEREDCAAQREVLQELAKEKRDLDLAVQAETASLKSELAEAKKHSQFTVCSYCGKVSDCGSSDLEAKRKVAMDHILTCDKRPELQLIDVGIDLERQIAELKAQIDLAVLEARIEEARWWHEQLDNVV